MALKVKADFQKVKKNRIFQDVVDQIQEAILNRTLRPGDMLPPERELRETFNISRGTLRESLRVLEQKGLIEIRLGTGGGAMVKNAGTEQLTETLGLMIRSGTLSVQDIGEFRQGIEGQIARLATRRATPEDIAILEDLVENARVKTSQGAVEAFLDIDQAVHKEMGRIAGNALYQYAAQVVHDNIRKYYDNFLDFTQKRMEENLLDLQRIVKAMQDQQPREAARIAEQHVSRFNERMLKKESLGH
ncbi:transcriptional regulator, GntR family [Desulfocicer vacuolatum DSM 3385]|uniref:Transcriptional regulator, GntR family n=1 Tax=Desulfocicer vacuolatum DSM 3385 TaxID=1121400 RepID=A0A1W2DYD9_9BACT|nr:FCD domain-containing protein [Desulfocicer vacuolatum]SMD02541.1 transcriptional regulator, GntR family [Desulfocicer vacuolatum DSM 3385]